MAEKRMFSNKITQSDAFLSMPSSSQNLYFHLSMDGDDDGFVNRPKSIMRMVGASEDDLNILITRKFIIPISIQDEHKINHVICVIKHWFIHNTIRADRKKDTTYLREKDMLVLNENQSYSLKSDMQEIPLQPYDNQVTTNWEHRLDKIRLDKYRLIKDICSIKMILANGNDYFLNEEFAITIIETYENQDHIDIVLELRKAAMWLHSNPSRRKTKKGMLKYIDGWLSRKEIPLTSVVSNKIEVPVYSKDTSIIEDVNEVQNSIQKMLGRRTDNE